MKTATVALLDAVRAKYKLTSDYQLGKLLGSSHSRISNYRIGRTGMDDDLALKVAALLGRPAGAVLAELAAERSKLPDVAKVWKDVARQIGRAAAVASMALGMALIMSDPVGRAYAMAGGVPGMGAAAHNRASVSSGLCIMLNSARAFWCRLKARHVRP